jgi:hypothetical protein
MAVSPDPNHRKVTQFSSPLEGPYSKVTQINDVSYRIQRLLKIRIKVIDLDGLARYMGTAPSDQP